MLDFSGVRWASGLTVGTAMVVAEAATDRHIPLITTVPAVYTEGAARQFLARQGDRLHQDLGYSLAVAKADTDRAIGQIGLWLRNLDQGRASIGYWVVPSARGRGAARHALGALLPADLPPRA